MNTIDASTFVNANSKIYFKLPNINSSSPFYCKISIYDPCLHTKVTLGQGNIFNCYLVRSEEK